MIIDLTHTITPEIPVCPGSPAPELSSSAGMTRNGYRETLLKLGSHSGTHMDAPRHMLPDGAGLDVLPISQFCGRAVVVDVSHLAPGGIISADFLRDQNGAIRSADFVLFYTGWEKKWGTGGYLEDGFPVPDGEAAKYLVSCGLKGVGTDALSIDPLGSTDYPAHKALLSGGLVIIESLCLKKVVCRKNFRLLALPLKYKDADGAPVRAVADFREIPEEKEMEQA
ncbi:MAG: cyclase family protein [Oscillospiraceae bacterium]|nr:cyclase family protein [Oscillospiraceae bacterium]